MSSLQGMVSTILDAFYSVFKTRKRLLFIAERDATAAAGVHLIVASVIILYS